MAAQQESIWLNSLERLTVDVSKATVVTLYMLPEFNTKLRPSFKEVSPGHVVSHDFGFEGWPIRGKMPGGCYTNTITCGKSDSGVIRSPEYKNPKRRAEHEEKLAVDFRSDPWLSIPAGTRDPCGGTGAAWESGLQLA
jgi:hypothetical protein